MESNNSRKKLIKKLRKHQHTVGKETGVVCTDSPTKNLVICNTGQINGLTEEIIVEHFEKYGHLDRVLLVPGKSCAFLSYKDTSSASEALEAVSGKLNIAQDGKPIFLSFVEALPEIRDAKIWGRLPPGLRIITNFVSEEEEARLLALCQFEDGGSMKHRLVKHYGYEFRYDINNVDKEKPLSEGIPQECDFLWRRLPFEFRPNQLTINRYNPGQGIPSHVDTHSAFGDPILSLSLSSDVVMEFKKDETICVLLPRRSLLVMAGESRYEWTHGIVPRTFDFYNDEGGCHCFKRGVRVSFTFRKIRKGGCNCSYKLQCDSQTATKIIESDLLAHKLENQHVHDVYEDIAGHFSETRHTPWPNVLNFVQKLEIGAVLVDVGCGNGKYFGHNRQIVELGTDRSFKLNNLCKHRGFEVFTGNCLNLPLKNSSADAVISIAVIHHLSTPERRLKALKEIVRILRIGGEALIYVWAKQQIKNDEKSTYIKQDRKNRKKEVIGSVTKEEVSVGEGVTLPVHTNRANFTHSDVLVPWKLKGEEQERTFLRFYHVFEEGELESLCQSIGNVSIVKSYYDQGNYCVQFVKNNK
ncbi:alkylated DNA repair protein alkB homolog 8 [Tribolium castaneum]|uniref:tRNA (carboxymethyluridine(34)-5-O)-methyltransferase n=1 Tax=Tribolium castaneum TaxID=7070 RepID=D2A2C2_TRICA|nr:PREDICTED: alkylated DNA repair protein alkB homolog 8 [Tribolium castaneum]EFA02043.1 Alkylated DNA repair protein alkB homolog 8-like Protein [Tribolium castaneum]|eukprot:XP_974935.1 PREDICTED: alkylated DNA repair protein alkB homolog 8 [Tribolium castaneum]